MNNFVRFLAGIKNRDMTRKDALTTEIKGNTIDTCNTADCGWETAIEREDVPFIVVEEYKSKKLAKEGHKKWVKLIEKNPKLELKEIRTAEEWFFG